MQQRPFIGNLLTSDPVRYARNVAVLEAEPSLSIAGHGGVGGLRFRMIGTMAEPGYPTKIRQPMLVIAAATDQIVSTEAIMKFAAGLRAGSHLSSRRAA